MGGVGREGGALVNGIKALIKRTQRALCPSFHHKEIQGEGYNLQKSSHQNPTMVDPELELPASRAMRNKLLFLTHPARGALL